MFHFLFKQIPFNKGKMPRKKCISLKLASLGVNLIVIAIT